MSAAALVALAACDYDAQVAAARKFVPRATEAFALGFIDTLRAGSPESAQRLLASPLDTIASVRDSLARIRAEFPPGTPERIELASFSRTVFSGAPARTELAYQLRYADGSAATAELYIIEADTARRVAIARVNRLPASLETINAFTLAGKGPAQWLVLLMTIGVVAFSVVTAVRIALTRGMPRRWLWVLASCVGIGKVGFNWTNGAVDSQLIAFQLFGAAVTRIGLLGPWLLAFSFPLGAIVALERRQRHLRGVAMPGETHPAPAPTEQPESGTDANA